MEYCINCTTKLMSTIDADPNGDLGCICAKCRAEECHDFDVEPSVFFDRFGFIQEKSSNMICQRCCSYRVLTFSGKCSDMFNAFMVIENRTPEHEGYVPQWSGLGNGDYIEGDLCLDCGQLQGEFPLPNTELETQ